MLGKAVKKHHLCGQYSELIVNTMEIMQYEAPTIEVLITLLFIITFAKSAAEILIQETPASIAQAAFPSAL